MGFAKKSRNKKFHSFVAISRKTLKNQEWKKLSPSAKLFYLHLKGKYNGSNNGGIHLHYSELSGNKGLSSSSTISRARKELEDKGWIKREKLGGLYRYHNEFRLTGKYDDLINW